MEITFTTPALLFPAISLLLLAFTNRFLAVASLIRQLHSKFISDPKKGVLKGQIDNLRKRLDLIRRMQIFSVMSFFCCVLSMFFIYWNAINIAGYIFGLSMVLLLISLGISLREVQISTRALEMELSDMED